MLVISSCTYEDYRYIGYVPNFGMQVPFIGTLKATETDVNLPDREQATIGFWRLNCKMASQNAMLLSA